ncbi:MAG: DUF3179 domain-containing protein, partial [Chloroflexota bacterium]
GGGRLAIIGALLLAACTVASPPTREPVTALPSASEPPDVEPWKTDFTRLADHVSPQDFVRALPWRDAIPALQAPVFVPASEVDWIEGEEPVIAVEREGAWRAYPLQILLWHEIVNDVLEGEPIAVTFCPLCHTAVVFDRRLDGETLEFGVTGYLRRSDQVMYDRQTESWWQQATGVGLVGVHAGRHLEILPSSLVAWSDFLGAHPDAGVLDRATGHDRPYGQNPYPGWDVAERNPFFKRVELLACDEAPGCIDPKDRVAVVSVNGETVVFPFLRLAAAGGLVELEIGDVPVVVWWQAGVRTALGNHLLAQGHDVGTVVAFDRRRDGAELSFELIGGALLDAESGTEWNTLGEATDGPLAGERLQRLQVDTPYWFGFAAFGEEFRVWPDDV